MGSDARDFRRVLRAQMKFVRKGGIHHRDLGARIQEEVVGAGMVRGDGHNHLVAVYEVEEYTGCISWAMGFC